MESLPPFRESVGMGDHRDLLLCEIISYLLCLLGRRTSAENTLVETRLHR